MMTPTERKSLVADCCTALWVRYAEVTAHQIADRVLDTPEWQADGYAGFQPYSRTLRYVRAYLKECKDAGTVLITTEGSSHYNQYGTAVYYSLAENDERPT